MQESGRSGAQDITDGQRAELLAARLLHDAERARVDPVAFFELVLREEKTNRRINCPECLKVIMQFALEARDTNGLRGRAAVIAPIGHGKSFSELCLILFWLAQNPNLRIGVVSAASAQAEKVLNTARSYIEDSPALRLVAPNLVRSGVSGDPWTQSAITVRRSVNARDPSVQAFGWDSKKIPGSRLDRVIVDDLLNFENCRTPEQRAKMIDWFQQYVVSRTEPDGIIMVSNSAVHSKDLLHYLSNELHWPTLVMSAYGQVQVHNTTFALNDGDPGADLLEPADAVGNSCVLSGVKRRYQDDPEHMVLFPERWTASKLEEQKATVDSIVFARNFLSVCREDESSLCKEEDVQRTRANGRAIGLYSPIRARSEGPGIEGFYRYTGQNPTFICVDLAFEQTAAHDYTAIVTVELVPSIVGRFADPLSGRVEDRTLRGLRVVLDVEYGRWGGTDIANKVVAKYRSLAGVGPRKRDDLFAPGAREQQMVGNVIVVVEKNGAQRLMRDLLSDRDVAMPVRLFNTTAQKNTHQYGVPALFNEMHRGLWAVPCSTDGRCVAPVNQLLEDCLDYVPDKHTSDLVMSVYFASDQCRRFDAAMVQGGRRGGMQPSLSASIMSR